MPHTIVQLGCCKPKLIRSDFVPPDASAALQQVTLNTVCRENRKGEAHFKRAAEGQKGELSLAMVLRRIGPGGLNDGRGICCQDPGQVVILFRQLKSWILLFVAEGPNDDVPHDLPVRHFKGHG